MQALVYPHDVASSVDGSDVYVVEISPNRILKLSSKRQVGWYLFNIYGLCPDVYFDVFGKF